MSEKLLPCPFCGGSNVKTFGPYGWYRQWGISHSCSSFYSGTSEMFQGFPNEAAAIAAWNCRAPDASLWAALEAIAQGYAVRGEHDRYVVVENPRYRPDNGSDPNICIDVAALSTMRASR